MDETTNTIKLYSKKKLIDINYHIYGSPKYMQENGFPNSLKDLEKT